MHHSLHKIELGFKTIAELKEIFSGIPEGVTDLDLRWNKLYRKTGAELK